MAVQTPPVLTFGASIKTSVPIVVTAAISTYSIRLAPLSSCISIQNFFFMTGPVPLDCALGTRLSRTIAARLRGRSQSGRDGRPDAPGAYVWRLHQNERANADHGRDQHVLDQAGAALVLHQHPELLLHDWPRSIGLRPWHTTLAHHRGETKGPESERS